MVSGLAAEYFYRKWPSGEIIQNRVHFSGHFTNQEKNLHFQTHYLLARKKSLLIRQYEGKFYSNGDIIAINSKGISKHHGFHNNRSEERRVGKEC